jgi:hypothetical protein
MRLLRNGAGWFGGHFGRQWIGGGFFVPQDAEDPPAGPVVEELDAVDAAGEELFVGGVARFVAAEDLRDVAEFLDAVDDGGFEEAVSIEVGSGEMNVVVNGEESRGSGSGVFCGAGEAGSGGEEGTEAVPVTRARGAGDYVVEGAEGGVDGFYFVGLGGWHGRGRILRRRRLRWDS